MSAVLLYAIVMTTSIPAGMVSPSTPCRSPDAARGATEPLASGVRSDADVRALFAAYSRLDAAGISRFVRVDIEREEPGHGIHTSGMNGIASLWAQSRTKYGPLQFKLERIAWLGPSIVLVEGGATAGALRKKFLTTLRLDSTGKIASWTEHWATDESPVALPATFVDDHIVMKNGMKRVLSHFAPRWVFADKTWQVRTSDERELREFGRRSNPEGIRGLSVQSARRLGPRTFAFEGSMYFKDDTKRPFSVVVLLDSAGRVLHRTDHFDLTGLKFPDWK
jgi:hypothetical protein